ncbi:hypothetical protein NHF46_20585 [Arthrobacter alpinus]|nr:hypothetical protein [Arthrobacter alpinus]
MSNGLYLGGVQLPFISSLRVYLPREAYTLSEFAYVEGLRTPEQNGISVDAGELADSLDRVSRTLPNPLPTPDGDRVRVLTMGAGEPTLYAPNQVVARSIASASELLSGNMKQLASLILPQEQWTRQLEHASQASHLELPIQTRNSTWGIPFSWFILVYANDRMEVVEANGRVLTVRIQVPLATALGRVERTLGMLAAMAPELDLFEELQDLATGLPASMTRAWWNWIMVPWPTECTQMTPRRCTHGAGVPGRWGPYRRSRSLPPAGKPVDARASAGSGQLIPSSSLRSQARVGPSELWAQLVVVGPPKCRD